MLLKFVELLIEQLPFINEFVIISNNSNSVSMVDNELEIIIYHDVVEEEINIYFGLTKYFKTKMNVIKYDNPTLVHMEKLAEYLDIDLFDCNVNTKLNMDNMIKVRRDQLDMVWLRLRTLDNYVNKLLEIILRERAKLLNLKEIQHFNFKNIKESELFKPLNYKKNIRLLFSHKNKLNGYDLKTLYYSMNNINI
jgi:hypothetical protein